MVAVIAIGLLILTGIVVYISTFKNEVGYKLRPISQFQDALFDYRYGYSFLFLVTSLLLSELTGTLAIFLYVSQKHFKIMIDTERDQVLEHNIINLLRNQQQHKIDDDDIRATTTSNKDVGDGNITYPRLRIISINDNDDYADNNDRNVVAAAPQSPSAIQKTINQNFLSADFGLIDQAYYQCGRHGTRGRRNSRSNESYLGSPRESVTTTTELKSIATTTANAIQRRSKNSFDSITTTAIGGDPLMQELCVEGLILQQQQQHGHNSGNKSTFV